MFETIEQAPPDAILGLSEAFRADPNPDKINLTVGVYQNEDGKTPILDCVKRAEERILSDESSKSYLGIDGLPEYCHEVPELLFGADHPIVQEKRCRTVQTPGGTGAVRVGGDLIRAKLAPAKVWCSQPTWANHPNIFQRAGLEVATYRYLNEAKTGLDFDGMVETLQQIPAGDAICLHACCHNPTGVDPTERQWETIAQIVRERNILPLVDCAYQGFGSGLKEDVAGILTLADQGIDLLIASSFSKNFGLYGERVGALTIVAGDADTAGRVLSQAKAVVRGNYSNPPKHGAAIVATVLQDEALSQLWSRELAGMRDRIRETRIAFVNSMQEKAPTSDFSPIVQQKGMFSFSGLTPLQVDRLRNEYSIYIVGSGRINVAGINGSNIDRLTSAIAAVL